MNTADSTALGQPYAPTAPQVLTPGLGCKVLAAAIAGVGVLGLMTGDFAGVWQSIPIEHPPYRSFLAYGCAVVELAAGAGLFVRPLAPTASAVLAAFLSLWALLLKLPAVLTAPQIEGSWSAFAEITVMAAGGWIVLLTYGGEARGPLIAGVGSLRAARTLFALSLLPIGLAHFFYLQQTAPLVPSWLPWHQGFAWLTGAGDIAAGCAVLLGRLARLAAALETAMLALITLLVWTPLLTPAPEGLQFKVTAFLISTAITAGAWVVADSYGHGGRFLRA